MNSRRLPSGALPSPFAAGVIDTIQGRLPLPRSAREARSLVLCWARCALGASAVVVPSALTVAALFVGCASHRPPGAASTDEARPASQPPQSPETGERGTGRLHPGENALTAGIEPRAAFAANARVRVEEQIRRFKMRCYASVPDRFRVEVRGPVGGIVLIATALDGRVRIVVPSKKYFAESRLQDDLGSTLLGAPLTGCDLGLIIREWARTPWFDPCPGRDEIRPSNPAGTAVDERAISVHEDGDRTSLDEDDRPGEPGSPTAAASDGPLIIERTDPLSGNRVQFTFVRSPSAVSIAWGDAGLARLTLDGFRDLEFPEFPGADFFWEPVPRGFTRVSMDALEAAEHR